jgi:hypothetical protein
MDYKDLTPIDYVIIGCGYTHRFDEHTDSINASTSNALVYNKSYGGYEYKNKAADFMELCIDSGLELKKVRDSMCFRCNNVEEAYEFAEILAEYEHCGCFTPRDAYERKIYGKSRKILYLLYETLSG